MSDEISLAELGIEWTSSPKFWHTIPKKLLPSCDIYGHVRDASGLSLFRLKATGPLGEGTFGQVDAFICDTGDNQTKKHVAVKRPKHPNLNLLTEALFQWKLHNDLQKHGLSFCIPKVDRIFTYKTTNDVWFSMNAYEPTLLSSWCVTHLKRDGKTFCLLILQISLILQIIEDILKVDHRDLKVNNMLVIDEPKEILFSVGSVKKKITFPFYVVFIDFGFACSNTLDMRNDGLPPLDFCPKEGRDMFQTLVSIWRIDALRIILEEVWGNWFRSKINSPGKYVGLTESAKDLTWMYAVTENREFRAPLCAPGIIIKDCMRFLEQC
jgi:serine/threonine protein kinase